MSKRQKPISPELAAYGAEQLRQRMLAVFVEMEGTRQGEDIEYLHRLRVASRRLRSALSLFGEAISPEDARRWTREVRSLTRALGPARDTDVQIDVVRDNLARQEDPALRRGVRRLLLRLSQRRDHLQDCVVSGLERFERSGVIEQMNKKLSRVPASKPPYPPELYSLAREAILHRLTGFLSYAEFVPQPDRAEELHTMRIAAKRLRYTLENFLPLLDGAVEPHLKAAKQAQEALDAIHDCDVWLAGLPAFLEEERERTRLYFGHTGPFRRISFGVLAFQADREQERQRHYNRFVGKWQGWQQAGFWESLPAALAAAAESPPGSPLAKTKTSPDGAAPAAES